MKKQERLDLLKRELQKNNARLKKESLMKEMQNFAYSTGPALGSAGGGGSPNVVPGVISQRWSDVYSDWSITEEKKESDPLILFFGFNGMLAKRYCICKGMSREEITARMSMTDTKKESKIPWSIHEFEPFQSIIEQFQNTENALSEKNFDDAMNIIRIGMQEEKIEDYKDSEEEEFTDNCLETCRPGNHSCGK